MKLLSQIKKWVRIALSVYPVTRQYAVPAFEIMDQLEKKGAQIEYDSETDKTTIHDTTKFVETLIEVYEENKAKKEQFKTKEQRIKGWEHAEEQLKEQPIAINEPDFSEWTWTQEGDPHQLLRHCTGWGTSFKPIYNLPIDFDVAKYTFKKAVVTQPKSTKAKYKDKRNRIFFAFKDKKLIATEDQRGNENTHIGRVYNEADYILCVHVDGTQLISRTKMTNVHRLPTKKKSNP